MALHKLAIASMRAVRLMLVDTQDFRRSERTMYDENEKKVDLGTRGVMLFVSKRGDQGVFVEREVELDMSNGRPLVIHILPSRRFRVRGGRLTPYVVQDHAERLGLHLEGLKRWIEYYEEEKERMVKERAKRRQKEAKAA